MCILSTFNAQASLPDKPHSEQTLLPTFCSIRLPIIAHKQKTRSTSAFFYRQSFSRSRSIERFAFFHSFNTKFTARLIAFYHHFQVFYFPIHFCLVLSIILFILLQFLFLIKNRKTNFSVKICKITKKLMKNHAKIGLKNTEQDPTHKKSIKITKPEL